MIEYWRNPEATRKKYAGDFLLTGDLGVQDDDGYFWYVSREDDVITTAGYRVGPSEIEDTLMKHPAVAMSAVVGIPDPIRTEAIKAWIVLRPGFAPSDTLAREIQDFVKVQPRRSRISAPRAIHRHLADDGDRKGAAPRTARAGVGIRRRFRTSPRLRERSDRIEDAIRVRGYGSVGDRVRGESPSPNPLPARAGRGSFRAPQLA